MSVLLKAKHRLNTIPIKIPMAFFKETEKNSCKIGIDLHCHSVAKLYSTLCNAMGCSTPGFPVPPISRSLRRFMFIESAMPSHPVALFSFCLRSFPASGYFSVSQLFASGGQSTGASTSASVLPKSTQG